MHCVKSTVKSIKYIALISKELSESDNLQKSNSSSGASINPIKPKLQIHISNQEGVVPAGN